MKNMKQIVCFALALVLVAVASVGITVAYLTDRDSKANIFTVGEVTIELNESFGQKATLIPGKIIEKKPTITNTGKNDAWVWATIAIPAALDDANNASKNIVHFNYTKESVVPGQWDWMANAGWRVEKDVLIDGIKYNVYTVLYQSILKVGQTTAHPVMTQVYLDTHVDVAPDGEMNWIENGKATKIGWNVNTYEYPTIYVSAYAIQAENFTTVEAAYAAYQAQWGDNGAEYATEPAATQAPQP